MKIIATGTCVHFNEHNAKKTTANARSMKFLNPISLYKAQSPISAIIAKIINMLFPPLFYT